jgi:hypothetical protein
LRLRSNTISAEERAAITAVDGKDRDAQRAAFAGDNKIAAAFLSCLVRIRNEDHLSYLLALADDLLDERILQPIHIHTAANFTEDRAFVALFNLVKSGALPGCWSPAVLLILWSCWRRECFCVRVGSQGLCAGWKLTLSAQGGFS